MARTVAIQMDPVENIDIDTDSTFVLGLESQERGHALWYYRPNDLFYEDGRVRATARPMTLRRTRGDHVALGAARLLDLADDVDVVLMRQDPPFDMGYITATHLLEKVHPETLVVNDPAQVRNAPEKLFVTRFSGLVPPTLITRDLERVRAFRDKHEDIVVKPLYGNGGAGVFHVKPGDENLRSIMDVFTDRTSEPVVVQAYLPAVREGDKRIILVDGEPVGTSTRMPAAGEARAGLSAGGRIEACTMTARDREICAAIGPELKARGLIFVGIDVIGGYMTEINVTSPTMIQQINRLSGSRIEALIWDAIEAKLTGPGDGPGS